MLTRAAAHARALLRAPTGCQRWARASSALTGQPGTEEKLEAADREYLEASSDEEGEVCMQRCVAALPCVLGAQPAGLSRDCVSAAQLILLEVLSWTWAVQS